MSSSWLIIYLSSFVPFILDYAVTLRLFWLGLEDFGQTLFIRHFLWMLLLLLLCKDVPFPFSCFLLLLTFLHFVSLFFIFDSFQIHFDFCISLKCVSASPFFLVHSLSFLYSILILSLLIYSNSSLTSSPSDTSYFFHVFFRVFLFNVFPLSPSILLFSFISVYRRFSLEIVIVHVAFFCSFSSSLLDFLSSNDQEAIDLCFARS